MSLVPTNVWYNPQINSHLPPYSTYPQYSKVQSISGAPSGSPYYPPQFGGPSTLNHPGIEEMTQFSKPTHYFHDYGENSSTRPPYLHTLLGSESKLNIGGGHHHKHGGMGFNSRQDWNINHKRLRKKGDSYHLHKASKKDWKEKGNSAAISALALLGFLFFLNLMQNSLATNRQLLLANKTNNQQQMASGLSIAGGFHKLKGRTGRERRKRGILLETTPYPILSHPIRTMENSIELSDNMKQFLQKMDSFPKPKILE